MGGHRIVRLRGAGGQGVVFEAAERGTGRLVALKMLLPDASSDDARRFEREIEVLASLDHPRVAALLDTGRHAGRPWFTMRLVEGATITQHAAGSLGPGAAVRLILPACDAVAHAHARGVIHRDLKPDNVRMDAQGEPVVLDFGLAKQKSSADLTQSSAPLGTLTHAAPEMLGGDVRRVDVRADVYSLGVMLYTMVSGRLPLEVPESLAEALEIVRHREPPPPSAHRPELDRDLDAICLRCLAKNPAERYASVLDLQRDLSAWLEGEPVEARGRAPGYRLRKALWRHRVPVVAASLAIAALAAQAVRLSQEVDRAQLEEAKATALATAFTSMLEDVDPESLTGDAGSPDPCERGSAARLLSHVGRRAQYDLDAEPRVRAAIHAAVGHAFLAIGVPARAVAAHVEALTALRSLPDASADELDTAELALLTARTAIASSPEDLEHFADLLTRLRQRSSESPALLATASHQAASVLRREGAAEAALGLAREALDLRRASAGSPREATASAILVAALMNDLGQPADALEILGEAKRQAESSLWRGHPSFARMGHERARALEALGRIDDAVIECEEALFALERSHGGGHPLVAAAAKDAARILSRTGRHSEAARWLQDVLELQRTMHGPHHPATHSTLVMLADELDALGEPREAECLRAEALIIGSRLDLAVP